MTKTWLVAIPLLVTAVGCRKSPEPVEGDQYRDQQGQWQPVPQPGEQPEQPAQPEQAAQAEQPEQGLPEARTPMSYREAIAQLRTSTTRIRESQDESHTELVNALHALTDAVAALPGVEDVDKFTTDMAGWSDQIQTSDPTSLQHADWTKSALEASIDQLEKVAKTRNDPSLTQRIDAVGAEVGKLEASKPLLDQRELVAATFEQLTGILEDLTPPRTGSL